MESLNGLARLFQNLVISIQLGLYFNNLNRIIQVHSTLYSSYFTGLVLRPDLDTLASKGSSLSRAGLNLQSRPTNLQSSPT